MEDCSDCASLGASIEIIRRDFPLLHMRWIVPLLFFVPQLQNDIARNDACDVRYCCGCASLRYGSGRTAVCHRRFAVRVSRQSRHRPIDSKERPFNPPTDASAIQAVSVSDVGWPGIGVQLNCQPERTGIENKWYTLTGFGYNRSFASHAPGRERRLEVRGFEPLAFSLRTRRSTN